MPGRWSGTDYRYAYQGSEKDDEITGVEGAHVTTFFREIDTRLGRMWSLDPKPNMSLSPYTSMGNNPILYNDVLGDTIKVVGNFGFRFRTNFNLLVLKVLGPKEVRDKIRVIENDPFVHTIKPTDGKVQTELMDNNNTEISLNRKGSDARTLSLQGEETGTFVKSKSIYVLTNELSHVEDFINGGEPGGVMGEPIDAGNGKVKMTFISNDEIDSNKDENLVRQKFGAKARKVDVHEGVRKETPKKARQFRKFKNKEAK